MDRSKKLQQQRGLPHYTSQLSPEPITASPFDFFEQQCPPVNFFCYSHNENSQAATGWKDGERDFCWKCYLSFSLSFWAASSWVFARPCPDGPLHWGTHSNINYPFLVLLLSFLQHLKILLEHHNLNSTLVAPLCSWACCWNLSFWPFYKVFHISTYKISNCRIITLKKYSDDSYFRKHFADCTDIIDLIEIHQHSILSQKINYPAASWIDKQKQNSKHVALSANHC